MIKVSATYLRKNLFEILNKVAKGETVLIERNKKQVARITPTTNSGDWRDQMSQRIELLVDFDELIKPMDDIWEGYI